MSGARKFMSGQRYHVWKTVGGTPEFIGCIAATDYVEAVREAEERFGAKVEIYLPPSVPRQRGNGAGTGAAAPSPLLERQGESPPRL